MTERIEIFQSLASGTDFHVFVDAEKIEEILMKKLDNVSFLGMVSGNAEWKYTQAEVNTLFSDNCQAISDLLKVERKWYIEGKVVTSYQPQDAGEIAASVLRQRLINLMCGGGVCTMTYGYSSFYVHFEKLQIIELPTDEDGASAVTGYSVGTRPSVFDVRFTLVQARNMT